MATKSNPITERPVGCAFTVHYDPQDPRRLRAAPMEYYVCGAAFAVMGAFFWSVAALL
ncbi:hypothetical protein [Streptomyces tailanensis]|uniref:hypothetical protein n=1 Tax=Streptomyces tailanensis TaxID=2569858 RepID=UPI00155A8FEC|nr:hypothetical protein [Streptomyces tailanensis]